jgi:hypothetical protein
MADGTTAHPVDATSIETAHPSSSVADRLTADLSTMDISARLPNFPIPRELRDQIYGYLLHSDYTRTPRKWSETPSDDGSGTFERHAYLFHTNILAVNKAIHEESEEFLYKNNVFVVASAEWHDAGTRPGRSLFSSHLWSPIITEKRASEMRHHSLHIQLTRGQTPMPRVDAKVPDHWCLFMGKDIEALCTMLALSVRAHPGFAIVIEDDPLPERISIMGWDTQSERLELPNHLKIQFLDTRFCKRDGNMQHSVLGHMQSIICPSMRVTFEGVLPECVSRIQRCKEIMGNKLTTRHARGWAHFENMCRLKQQVDDSMSKGEFHIAEASYVMIASDSISYISRLLLFPQFIWPAAEAFRVLCLDVILTLGYAQLRLGKVGALRATTNHLGQFVAQNGDSDLPEGMQAVLHHFVLLSGLYTQKLRPTAIPQVTVACVVRILKRFNHLPYPSHDLAILSKVDQRDLALEHLPLNICSVSVLGQQYFSFHRSQEIPRRPNNIVG